MGAKSEHLDDPDQHNHQRLFYCWILSGRAEAGARVRRQIPGIPAERLHAFPLAMAKSEDRRGLNQKSNSARFLSFHEVVEVMMLGVVIL